MFKKQQIYLIVALLFLIIIFFSVLIFSGGHDLTEDPTETIPVFSPSSSFRPTVIKPVLTEEVPLKPVTEGGGVNLESSIVQQSQTEITKILPFLPYEDEFVSSSGKAVSILIPGAQFQTTPWIIDVQIFGIDYQVSREDRDYGIEKNSFLEAASKVFEWMSSTGIDPEKIIINWGDKAYIRESAEKWLSQ